MHGPTIPAVAAPPTPSKRTTPPLARAYLTPWPYRICWLLILGIHSLSIGYTVVITWFYHFLPDTYLEATFIYIHLGLAPQYSSTIAYVHIASVAPHVLAAIMMLVSSLVRRRLIFYWESAKKKPTKAKAKQPAGTAGPPTTKQPQRQRPATPAMRLYAFLYKHAMTNDGIFGIDHPHFDLVLLGREIMETGFQTYQGYRMSLYLPRTWLNRLFVGLLVFNCWSTALVQYVFRHDEAKRRLVCLLCDALLDLICSVGIPTTVFMTYWAYYDPEIEGFPEDLWYNDTFLVNIMTELQMFVVSSWLDLMSRASFTYALYSALTCIKDLLKPKRSHGQQRGAMSGPGLAAIAPSSTVSTRSEREGGPEHGPPPPGLVGVTTAKKRWVDSVHGVLFGAWGALVMVLHLYAESFDVVPDCLLQVRPWGTRLAGCSLLEANCHKLQLSGTSQEMDTTWSQVEANVLLRLVVRHCPALEIPPKIQEFEYLTGFKIYNSTVVQWDDEAALTAPAHPNLKFVQLVRVNLPNGTIPAGLRSYDFPPELYVLEICKTNIAWVPDDLDKSWHKGTTLYIESSQLTEFADVLVRLQLKHIGVGDNPIRELPPGVFESPNLVYMSVGGTLITDLPLNVSSMADTLCNVILTNTNITHWYSWMDPWLDVRLHAEIMYISVLAGGSPYCTEYDEFFAGNRTNFSVTASPHPDTPLSSILMNTSEANMENLWYSVYCEYFDPVFFPLALEDATYGVDANQ